MIEMHHERVHEMVYEMVHEIVNRSTEIWEIPQWERRTPPPDDPPISDGDNIIIHANISNILETASPEVKDQHSEVSF